MAHPDINASSRAKKAWALPTRRYGVILFTVTLLLAVLFRRFFVDAGDPYKCKSLMSHGQWWRDGSWLTSGCVSEGYSRSAIHDCAKRRKIVFVGDYSIQGTYWALLSRLDGNVQRQSPVESNLHYADDGMEIDYYYDPYVNGSDLFYHTQAFREDQSRAPLMMIVGGGHRYAELGTGEEYVNAVQRIADSATSVSGRISAGTQYFSRADGPGSLLLFAPLQEPYDGSADNAAGNSPYAVANQALKSRSESHDLDILWSFADMTDGRKDKYADNLMQASDSVETARANLVLSLRCNAKRASLGFFPNLRSCCATWKTPNWIQASFLLLGLFVLPTLASIDYLWPIMKPDDRTIIRAFCGFTSGISLMYLTDRTHLFEVVKRMPVEIVNLRNMLIAWLVIGLVSIRRSPPPKKAKGSDKQPDHPYLPRDQTDEWKGWMQAMIICYHYNSAWHVDWFWEIIRLAVSSYLFLTGFGHTVFFLQKRDFSFRRFAAVMIRTNLLPVALAYVMRTRWLLYYYMPLSTFWFLVVYATLGIAPGWNEYTPLLLGKIGISAAVVQAFLRTEDLPNTVVKFFALTCKMSFDAREFFGHRVMIDSLITYVGMIVAIFYIWSKDVLASDQRRDMASRLFRRTFPWLKYVAVGASLAAMIAFWILVHQRLHSQSAWTHIQPYITVVPILTFTILRNAHPVVRNFHSAAFAWLGRYSGEMYVMQNHIWLAGDQEAVLRTGFFHGDETVTHDRFKDLLLLTPLYLVACYVIGEATTIIAVWFTAEPKKVIQTVRKQPQEEVEMGLLAGADGEETDELDEKAVLPPSRWERVRSIVWPDKVRTRAILVMLALWFMNLTYT